MLMTKIANKLRTHGEKVLLLNYADEQILEHEDFDHSYQYSVNESFSKVRNLRDLINSKNLRKENYGYDYIMMELPAIIYNDYPMELIQQVDASLLILKGSSSWNKADESTAFPVSIEEVTLIALYPFLRSALECNLQAIRRFLEESSKLGMCLSYLTEYC